MEVATSVLAGMEAMICKEDREEGEVQRRIKDRIWGMDSQLPVDMDNLQLRAMGDTSSRTTRCNRSNMMPHTGMQTPTIRSSHHINRIHTSSPNNNISQEPWQVRTIWVKLADTPQ